MMRQITSLGIMAILTAALLHEGTAFSSAAEPAGSPVPATPPFASPDIKPTLFDWLTARPVALQQKIGLSDPLQKPPFVGQPPDSLKGMAAGIRAVQLDAPNRVKAAAYLGTVDCVTYPQAQAMLISAMQEDPSEAVRYEAVLALRMMLMRGCGNMESECECERCSNLKKVARETEQHAKKAKHKLVKEAKCHAKIAAIKANRAAASQEARYDCCRGCCNEKVLKALAEVAYGKDDQCCWIEPSERVREAAAQGMGLCKVYPGPIYGDSTIPPVEGTGGEEEMKPTEEKEVDPATPEPKSPAPPSVPVTQLSAKKSPPVLQALNGFCIVGLKQRQFIAASEQFSSIFEDHTYLFASSDAKAEFDSNPAEYAPAYGGVDPVVWLERHEMVEGKYLREFDGRFYLFTEKEKWETFKSTPQRFVLRKTKTPQDLVSN